MVTLYCPERGDLIWVDFTPQAGREQAGRRPALVLSSEAYNSKTRLALVCPITSKAKGYPFEIELPQGLALSGVVLSDHVKNMDWFCRKATRAGKAPAALVAKVVERIQALLEPF